jgi:acyl-CoA oxidase
VQGLETTATYDSSTQEFILHSPTLTSTKWWPGSLGKTVTHAVVMAQLLIGNQTFGVHPFVVQLRSLTDHKSLPGVTLGDIGPKLGYNTLDNGFLRFDHYRIPRSSMLMRYAGVTPDGKFQRSSDSHAKISYITMVKVRSTLMFHMARYIAIASTISLRYSAVRQQGFLKGDSANQDEQFIIDYQLQQYRLFPILASAFAYWFVGRTFLSTYFFLHSVARKINIPLS